MYAYFCVSYKNKVYLILKSCKIYDGVQLYLRTKETVQKVRTSRLPPPPPFQNKKQNKNIKTV